MKEQTNIERYVDKAIESEDSRQMFLDAFSPIIIPRAFFLYGFNPDTVRVYIEVDFALMRGVDSSIKAMSERSRMSVERFSKGIKTLSRFNLIRQDENGDWYLTNLKFWKEPCYIPNKIAGQVYVVNAVGTNLYKIGFSTNFNKRLKALSKASPYKLEPIYLFDSLDARNDEKLLHDKFADKRTNGEWFKLSSVDICKLELLTQVSNVVI